MADWYQNWANLSLLFLWPPVEFKCFTPLVWPSKSKTAVVFQQLTRYTILYKHSAIIQREIITTAYYTMKWMNLTESALENWCLGTWEHVHSLTFKYLVTSLCFMSSSLTFHNICFSTGIRYHILPYCIHLTQQCMETLRVYQAERPTFKNLSEAAASRSKEIHALFMFIYTQPPISLSRVHRTVTTAHSTVKKHTTVR